MWTREEYENAAQKIGEDFVASCGETSINDLSLKVAQDAGLNPYGIRTMVRLANVAAFEKFFEKGAADKTPDRMIEFGVGDPEVVIAQLHKNAQDAQVQEKTAERYSRVTDYNADFKYAPEPLEKTATVIPGVELTTPADNPPSPAEVKLLFKRAEDRMREEHRQAQHYWASSLEKAAKLLISADSRVEARTAFEKNAASLCGEDIIPELRRIHVLTSPDGANINLFGGEKTASVIEKHVASVTAQQKTIIELLKSANVARKDSHLKEAALQWIEENIARVK